MFESNIIYFNPSLQSVAPVVVAVLHGTICMCPTERGLFKNNGCQNTSTSHSNLICSNTISDTLGRKKNARGLKIDMLSEC